MALTLRVTDIEQLQAQRIGYMAVSLTEYDSDLEPEIAEGSVLEIGGAVYEAAADEPITGWGGIGNSNDVYILIDAGTLGAVFTLVAPTWSTTKQGWYDGLDRYVAKLYKDAGGDYTLKRIMAEAQQTPTDAAIPKIVSDVAGVLLRCKVIETGDWNMDTLATLSVDHGLDYTKIRAIRVLVRDDSGYLRPDGIASALDTSIGPQVFIYTVSATAIGIHRVTGSSFDSTSYDSTAYNRGWVTIWYEV